MSTGTKAAVEAGFVNAVEQVRERILHALEIFPFISSSMLHQAIGTATLGSLWKPVLNELIEEGLVVETTFSGKSSGGRTQSYSILHLPRNKYSYPLSQST
jgi:hypothetical protein